MSANHKILDLIEEDHVVLRRLLTELAETHGASDGREELFAELKETLQAHAQAEELTLYADLLAKEESQKKTRHSVSEHKEADDLLEELAEMDMQSSAWIGKLRELKEEVEHHIEEEEGEIFPLARKALSQRRSAELGERFAKLEENH